MKNKRKVFKWLGLFLMFFILLTTVSADATPTPINPDQETSVTDKAEQYNLDSYQSYMVERKRWFQSLDIANWLNGGANLFFDLNKIIFSMFRTGIDLFGNANVINDYVSVFTTYSKSMYDSLYRDFGLTIIVAMALYCLYLYIMKSPQQAAKQFFAFSAVVIISMVWNNSATTIIRDFNSLTEEVQGNLIRTTSNAQSTNATTPVTHAQNTLFELAIEEPFLLMNFGVASRSEVISAYDASAISSLMFSGEWTPEKDAEIEKVVKERADENVFMTTDKAGWKFVVGFLSPITTIVLGTPILILQVLNLLTGIMALIVSAFIGLAMFISMIPRFRGAFLKSLQSLIGLFAIRVLLGISFMMLVSVINVIRGVIPADGVANYLLQVIAITVTIVVVWKNRDKIFKMISGGMISSVDGGLWNKASAPFKKKAKDTAKLGADVAGLVTVGVPLGEVIPNAGKNAANSMRENAYDIYADRQAFKQQEKDDQTQFAVDDYFDTVDRAKGVIDGEEQANNQQSENVFDNGSQYVGATEESVELDDMDLDVDDVQAEINELEATDVQETSENGDKIDTVEIETAETENVEKAEINELEAADVQTTNDEANKIDTVEIETAETENVEQAEINELESTDVQTTNDEAHKIDTVEIETAETGKVEQAKVNGLEATDLEITGELETDQVTGYQSVENVLSANEIDYDAPDIYLEHLDQQTNEFFAQLENETLVQANSIYQSEEAVMPHIVESHSFTDSQNMIVNTDFGAEIKKQELETNKMSVDEKTAFDALLAEVRGE
ncbi:CD3337/EF1877 family mobilome membrane protein [Enterococcus sp. DIV1059_2]|uniref:CD3337/EF1877 family mobilome membrane protein n=1 Tax=Enterococcus sp. DIV1059_2 TaxID=2774664 RepID=UPI003F1F85E2